jgi:hypothetical protein
MSDVTYQRGALEVNVVAVAKNRPERIWATAATGMRCVLASEPERRLGPKPFTLVLDTAEGVS